MLHTVSTAGFLLWFLGSTACSAKTEDAAFWYREGTRDLKNSLNKEMNHGTAKNIIIFIGDGMGVSTHTMARIYKGQKNGETGEEGSLFWENFPYSGLIKTYNTDYQVPDSAGTASAILSGVKTSLGVLGVDMSVRYNVCDSSSINQGKVETVMNWGIASKKEVGIVTTARVTHATPGAMYAHTANRDWEADTDLPVDGQQCVDIARQLVASLEEGQLVLAMGGGSSKFRTKANGGVRNDTDLINYLQDKGIQVVQNTEELQKWDYSTQMVGLFAKSHMDYETQRDKSNKGQPSLSEMTRQAITRLSRSKAGFVLLVEAGKIDHAHHDNLAKLAMEETLELDRAVKVALEMIDISETLVMVTADHSHAVTINGYPKRGNNILGSVFLPDQEWGFMTTKENKTQPYQTISYANGPGFLDHFDPITRDWRNISEMDVNSDSYHQPSTYYLASETHGGEDVSVYARGPQAHLVTGLHEQSFLGVLMGYAGCINKNRFGCPSSQSSAALRSETELILVISSLLLPYIYRTLL